MPACLALYPTQVSRTYFPLFLLLSLLELGWYHGRAESLAELVLLCFPFASAAANVFSRRRFGRWVSLSAQISLVSSQPAVANLCSELVPL